MTGWTALFFLLFVLPAVLPTIAGGYHFYRSIQTDQYADWEQLFLGGVTGVGGFGVVVATSSIAGVLLGFIACGGFLFWLVSRTVPGSDPA